MRNQERSLQNLAYALGTILLFFMGCAPNASDPCQEAVEHINSCLGEAHASYSGCTTEDEAASQEVLAMSCEDLLSAQNMGGADSLFCLETWNIGFCNSSDDDSYEPTGEPVRYPIVLAHGFQGGVEISPLHRRYFLGVADALRADGHEVFEAEVHPYASIEVRAEQLGAYIYSEVLATTGAQKVNIIAHSMGGLDSRYLVANPEVGCPEGFDCTDRIASVTTVSTPHRGSDAADLILEIFDTMDENTNVDWELVNSFFGEVGSSYNSHAENPAVREALVALSTASTEEFNQRFPFDPSQNVAFYSWAGRSNLAHGEEVCASYEGTPAVFQNPPEVDVISPVLLKSALVLLAKNDLAANDGMVLVDSAKWGTFLGCIPADHADQIGMSEDPNPISGFDHIKFYREHSFFLTNQGY